MQGIQGSQSLLSLRPSNYLKSVPANKVFYSRYTPSSNRNSERSTWYGRLVCDIPKREAVRGLTKSGATWLIHGRQNIDQFLIPFQYTKWSWHVLLVCECHIQSKECCYFLHLWISIANQRSCLIKRIIKWMNVPLVLQQNVYHDQMKIIKRVRNIGKSSRERHVPLTPLPLPQLSMGSGPDWGLLPGFLAS